MTPGCLFVDAVALMAAIRWPSTASTSFILALLWLAVLFSATAFFALRTPTDGGGDDGDDSRRTIPSRRGGPTSSASSATTRGRDPEARAAAEGTRRAAAGAGRHSVVERL